MAEMYGSCSSSLLSSQLPFLPASFYCLSSLSTAPQARTRPAGTDFVNKKSKTNSRFGKQLKAVVQSEESARQHDEGGGEEEFRVLTAIQSIYNRIVILDTPKSRLLLLDSTNNVHSMINKGSKWTGSNWDELAALPPIVPEGPIAIFGLLIHKSRDYLGLFDLEKRNTDGGVLNIHIGDAFFPSASIPGGYAGIIIDLFADGKVLPQLEEAGTWLELHDKLMPNGRFMVNCGAGKDRSSTISNADSIHDESSIDGTWKLNATIEALCKAFPGQVNWKKLPKSAGENYLALTGSLPDLTTWSAALPDELGLSVIQWRACNISVS